jgi:hypothetical protein
MTKKEKISKFFGWVVGTLFFLFLFIGSEILDTKLSSIPEEWHGTYSLEKEHFFWTDDYDYSQEKLGCTITEGSLTLIGKKHDLSKILLPRFASRPRVVLYISSWERFELVRLPSGELWISEYQKRPSGPDSESWVLAGSYGFKETE